MPGPATPPAPAAVATAAPAPNPGPQTPPVAANPPPGLEVGQAVNKPIALSSFPHSSAGQNKVSGLKRAETLSLLYKHAGRLGLLKKAVDVAHCAAQVQPAKRRQSPPSKGPLAKGGALQPRRLGAGAGQTVKSAAGLLDYLGRPGLSLGMLKHASDRNLAARMITAVHRAKQRLS